MKIIRHLCNTYPAHRKFFISLGYGLLIFGGALWYICLLIPALALTFLDPSHLVLASTGIPVRSPRVLLVLCWFMTLVGLAVIYFSVKELKKLRLES